MYPTPEVRVNICLRLVGEERDLDQANKTSTKWRDAADMSVRPYRWLDAARQLASPPPLPARYDAINVKNNIKSEPLNIALPRLQGG